MNRSWVQRMGAVLPWRKILKLPLIQRVVCTTFWYKPLSLLFHGIEIGGAAPIRPVPGSLFQIAALLQIVQRPLDRGAGQLHVRGNGLNARPALSLGIGAIPQVHIDRLRSGGKLSVDLVCRLLLEKKKKKYHL